MMVGERFTCALSIAGLGVALHCNDAALAAALRQRYRDFPLENKPLLTAQIALVGTERAAPLYDPTLAFHDSTIRFTTPGYMGLINVQVGHAELTISSAYPIEDVEYFVRVIYALLAFRAGGLLVHGAGIVRNGRGYLFCGYSGSGKTTVARLSSGAHVLNDDLMVVLPESQSWMLYATPFWNPTQVRPGEIKSGPLTALLRLVQAPAVALEPLGAAQALAEIIANVPVLPADPGLSYALLRRGKQLLDAVPAYRLRFLPDPSFWPLVEALR